MNLYSLAIQQLTRQHMATIEALVRQQPEFERVEYLAGRLRESGVRAEARYVPAEKLFIAVRGGIAQVETALEQVCRLNRLHCVPGSSSWQLVHQDHSITQPAVLVIHL